MRTSSDLGLYGANVLGDPLSFFIYILCTYSKSLINPELICFLDQTRLRLTIHGEGHD